MLFVLFISGADENMKYSDHLNIQDQFPQNKRKGAKFYFQESELKMIHSMSGLLLSLGSKTYYFLRKFLCFLLIFDIFSKPYLLWFPGDLSLILG